MNARTTTRILSALVFLTLMTSAIGAAQLGSLSGPVLGYVFDKDAGRMRPVRGIPGSATVGVPIDSVAVAHVLSLDTNHVIASSATSSELLVLSLSGSEASSLVIPGAPANPSRAAASRRGTAAAFYYADTHLLHVVTGLPTAPQTASIHQLDGPVTQLAINDDATLFLFAVSQEDGEALYSWSSPSGNATFVTFAGSISGLAITRNGDAIVTDRKADEVFAIWNAAGSAVRRLLADKTQGVSSPAGVVVSSDDRIYVGNAGSGTVTVLDANGRFLNNPSCDCMLSGMFPLRDSLFRLTDRIDQTTFLLDVSAAEARIVFVPPPQE